MEVEFTLTTNDLLALERHLLDPAESFLRERDLADGSRLRQSDWRWGKRLWPAAALVACLGVIACRDAAVLFGALDSLAYWGAVVALATLGVLYCVRQHSRHVARNRLHYHPWNLWTRGPMRIALTPEGVTKVCAFSRSVVSWRVIAWVTATPEHIFLYDTTDSAYVVPRRAFRDGTHFREFLHLARDYLAGAAPPPGATPEPPGVSSRGSTAIQRERGGTEDPHASGTRLPLPGRIGPRPL